MTAPATDKTPESVKFEISTKNLNVGDTTARLGWSINLVCGPNEAANTADFVSKTKLFCCAKLQLKIMLTQDTLPGVEGPKSVDAVVESKNLSLSPKAISGGFVFGINDIDPGQLAQFTKKDCTIEVSRIGLADSDDEDDKD